MLDAFAYTSERVPPVTGPRAPEDRKAKGGTSRRARSFPALQPGSAIVVAPGILAELNAISGPTDPPNPYYPMLNMDKRIDPFFTGYPVVSDPQLAGLRSGMLA